MMKSIPEVQAQKVVQRSRQTTVYVYVYNDPLAIDLLQHPAHCPVQFVQLIKHITITSEAEMIRTQTHLLFSDNINVLIMQVHWA